MICCAYERTIATTVPIPGAVPASNQAAIDVHVHRGETPAILGGSSVLGTAWDVTGHQRLLTVPGVARVLVDDSGHVVVDASASADPADVASVVTGPALATILHDSRACLLRASAVATPRGAVLLLGASGAGKSALAAALAGLGFPLVTDDIALVRFHGDRSAVVARGFGAVRLTEEVIATLSLRTAHAGRRGTGKLPVEVPLCDSIALPVLRAYVLEAHNHPHIALQASARVAAVRHFSTHTYMRRLWKWRGGAGEHHARCGDLAGAIPLTVLQRPVALSSLAELAARLSGDMAS